MRILVTTGRKAGRMGANIDDANTRPSTSNELLQVSNSGKVFNVRRVSLGVQLGERVSVASCSQADLYVG